MPMGFAWHSARKKAIRLTDSRQRLRITQMCVHIHQANLATEERRALGSLEETLRAAVIVHRPIEQSHAIRTAQSVQIDQAQVLLHLLGTRTDPRGWRGSSPASCTERR